jgi:GAF domain-containing protein
LVFQERFVGALEVIDDDPARTWQDNEILLLLTVANQVAAAINHADLFAQMQQQALTTRSPVSTTVDRSRCSWIANCRWRCVKTSRWRS